MWHPHTEQPTEVKAALILLAVDDAADADEPQHFLASQIHQWQPAKQRFVCEETGEELAAKKYWWQYEDDLIQAFYAQIVCQAIAAKRNAPRLNGGAVPILEIMR